MGVVIENLKFYQLGLKFKFGLFRLSPEDRTPAKPVLAEAGSGNLAES